MQRKDKSATEAKMAYAARSLYEGKTEVFQKTYIFVKILLAIPDGSRTIITMFTTQQTRSVTERKIFKARH